MSVDYALALKRSGYRVAYRLLQALWFVTRPHKRGVKCLVTDEDRVLLVRHTYGDRCWDLPGGAIKRGESPASAAHREMIEELGLDGAQWSDLGEVHGTVGHRQDTIHCFRAELRAPELRIDPGELEVARWFRRGEVPVDDVGPYVSVILARAPAQEGGRSNPVG